MKTTNSHTPEFQQTLSPRKKNPKSIPEKKISANYEEKAISSAW